MLPRWRKPIDVQLATEDELAVMIDILIEAAGWLSNNGVDQWPVSPRAYWHRRAARAISRQEAYLAYVDGSAQATLRLIWVDDYWPNADKSAAYLHSLAIRDGLHGQGLGVALLAWCKAYARAKDKTVLRLDCLAGNRRLRQYYEAQGFIYQREIVDNDYNAALYEIEL